LLSRLLLWAVWRGFDEAFGAVLAGAVLAGSRSMVWLSSRSWLMGYAWAERKEKFSRTGALVGEAAAMWVVGWCWGMGSGAC
jgi:hypothetical protein